MFPVPGMRPMPPSGGGPIGQPMPIGGPPFRTPFQGGDPGRQPMPLQNGPDMRPILGTMHKGGKIKKTGLYNMKKGEKVVPAKLATSGKPRVRSAGRRRAATVGQKHKMVSVSALKA